MALLLSRAGDLVSRDDLRAHLWSEETHVDFDRGLAYCIGQLRTALGDTADNPRFVQTLPRRGFRFIAPVEAADGAHAQTVVRLKPDATRAEADTRAQRDTHDAPLAATTTVRSEPGAMTLATAVVVIVVAGAGWWMVARNRAPGRPIVAVAVFDNESGDAARDRAIAGLSDVVVERLTALGPDRIGVNGNATVLRRPRADRDQQAVVRDTRASFLVSGQLQARDGRLSLLMQLIRLDDGTHVWVQRISRPAGDTLESLDEDAARQIEAAVRRLVLKDAARAS